MSSQEMQTADGQARITLPAEFADTAVIVEVLSPSEVRIRKAEDTAMQNIGTEELMRLAETSGALDFWNALAEDIYGPDDGETASNGRSR